MQHKIDADKSISAGKKYLGTALTNFKKVPVNYSLAYNVALMGIENYLAGILSKHEIEIDGHGVNFLTKLAVKNNLLPELNLDPVLEIDQILSPHQAKVAWPDENLQKKFIELVEVLVNRNSD
jgi:hypothetical protein